MLAEHVVNDLERAVVLVAGRFVALLDRILLFGRRGLLLFDLNLLEERRENRGMDARQDLLQLLLLRLRRFVMINVEIAIVMDVWEWCAVLLSRMPEWIARYRPEARVVRHDLTWWREGEILVVMLELVMVAL